MNSLLLKAFYCCALIGCMQAGNTHIVVGGVVVDGQRVNVPGNINTHSTNNNRRATATSISVSILGIRVPSVFKAEQSVTVDQRSGSVTHSSSVGLDISNCIGYLAFFIGGYGCLYGLRKILNKEYALGGVCIATPITFSAARYMWMQRQRN